MYACTICTQVPSTARSKCPDPRNKLQVAVHNHMVLGTELGSCERITCAISHWVTWKAHWTVRQNKQALSPFKLLLLEYFTRQGKVIT